MVRQRVSREFRYAGEESEQDEGEEEEADPLEAFMAGIEVSVCDHTSQ